jgi:hypothetical protein
MTDPMPTIDCWANRRPGGRPAFEPTHGLRQTVQVMRSNGDTLETIARAVGDIDLKTLNKHSRSSWRSGAPRWLRRWARRSFVLASPAT